MTLSIIMPVLNEAAGIAEILRALAPYRARGVEVIVVDGGSSDGTASLAHPLADRIVNAPRGRAMQMNAGAACAKGDVFLFLHADTRLPENADALIAGGLARTKRLWGRFDVRFDNDGWLNVIAFMMNWRSRVSGIATGDQAIFITRTAFDEIGGFPVIALMEDVAASARLKRRGRPLCLPAHVTTSARRWRQHGVWRTILLMWRLRLAFFLGSDPKGLARHYGYVPHES
ncbi:MAG TPA: TIGR04283 family arsenosugar biosynthesis glycosyltransferase [Pseudolabrys sp.]|nr:TIGR04283 family arsenosugar biosynthesis glycosyltransferase [Pseudolabrys sp.]